MENSKKTLVEEKQMPEKKKLLGSKTTSMLPNGSMQKVVKIPFCDSCNSLLKDVTTLCSLCQRKICLSCAVMYKNKNYCRQCASQIISVTKEQCMVLLGVSQQVDLKKIKKFSCMNLEDLRMSVYTLLKRNLIEKKGLCVLAHCAVTHNGLSLLPTCEHIYLNEGDFQHFIMRVKNFVRER